MGWVDEPPNCMPHVLFVHARLDRPGRQRRALHFVLRHSLQLLGRKRDVRRNEEQKLGLGLVHLYSTEENAEAGDVSQQRILLIVCVFWSCIRPPMTIVVPSLIPTRVSAERSEKTGALTVDEMGTV